MIKRLVALTITMLLIVSMFPALAFGVNVSLTLSKDTAKVGDSITATGTADSNSWVSVKVVDSTPNTTVFDAVKADGNGAYSCTFVVPAVSEGTVTVVAGYGDNVASKNLTITSGTVSPKNNNANLASLVTNMGSLTPSFDPNVTSYSITLPSGTVVVPTITATAADTAANVAITPATGLSANTQVKVTAEDGTIKTYTISFTVNSESRTVITIPDDLSTPQTVDVPVSAANKNFEMPDIDQGNIDNLEIKMDVPSGVEDATVKVQTSSNGGNQVATLPQWTITSSVADVSIPAGSTIAGPSGWNGIINLPTVKANSTVTVTADSGKTATVSSVVEVGFGDIPLTFDKAVRILIPGQAGKYAGYSRGSTFTPITTILAADTQAAGDALPANGDGKIDVGSDLIIWTKHFTKFASYTQTATSVGGGGGGGGGAIAASAVNSTSGTASVTPNAGGTVGLGSDAVVEIPASALNGTTAVEVKVQKIASPPPVPSGFNLASGVFEFSIGGQNTYSFAKNVTLKLTFDASIIGAGNTPAVHYYDEASGKWVNLNGTVSGNTITVQVNHFTKFAVLAAEKTAAVPVITQPAVTLNDIIGHWAQASIEKLVAMGAVSGYSDGTFKPNGKITRAEFVTILVKALKLESKSGKVFNDTANSWAKDYISTATAYGIINGYSDTVFGPDDLITREQMAVIIVQAAKLTKATGSKTFADNAEISSWAMDAIVTASENNIIAGYSDNTFKPKNNASRAEAVTVIVRALK